MRKQLFQYILPLIRSDSIFLSRLCNFQLQVQFFVKHTFQEGSYPGLVTIICFNFKFNSHSVRNNFLIPSKVFFFLRNSHNNNNNNNNFNRTLLPGGTSALIWHLFKSNQTPRLFLISLFISNKSIFFIISKSISITIFREKKNFVSYYFKRLFVDFIYIEKPHHDTATLLLYCSILFFSIFVSSDFGSRAATSRKQYILNKKQSFNFCYVSARSKYKIYSNTTAPTRFTKRNV
jgi:hypothetical protein